MEQCSDPGSGIRDKQTKFVNSLYKKEVGSGIRDPGSGAFLPPGSGIRIRDGAMVGSGSGIRDKTSRIRNTDLSVGSLPGPSPGLKGKIFYIGLTKEINESSGNFKYGAVKDWDSVHLQNFSAETTFA
jgi:hypothetical protein